MEGLFAIDVKTKRDKWRIILCPLDEDEEEFIPCHIDEIAGTVKTVEESGLTQEDYAKRLGTTINYWLNLQQTYDAMRAEFLSNEELKKGSF